MIACELRYDNWFLTGLALAHAAGHQRRAISNAAEQHRLANLPENIARASFLLLFFKTTKLTVIW